MTTVTYHTTVWLNDRVWDCEYCFSFGEIEMVEMSPLDDEPFEVTDNLMSEAVREIEAELEDEKQEGLARQNDVP